MNFDSTFPLLVIAIIFILGPLLYFLFGPADEHASNQVSGFIASHLDTAVNSVAATAVPAVTAVASTASAILKPPVNISASAVTLPSVRSSTYGPLGGVLYNSYLVPSNVPSTVLPSKKAIYSDGRSSGRGIGANFIMSPNKKFKLIITSNGDLKLTNAQGTIIYWVFPHTASASVSPASVSSAPPAYFVGVQSDGSLNISNTRLAKLPFPLSLSETAVLRLYDTGRLALGIPDTRLPNPAMTNIEYNVLYDKTRLFIRNGEFMTPHQILTSQNGKYNLSIDTYGKISIYKPYLGKLIQSTVIRSTPKYNSTGAMLMVEKGAAAIIYLNSRKLQMLGQGTSENSALVLGNDGKLGLYDPDSGKTQNIPI